MFAFIQVLSFQCFNGNSHLDTKVIIKLIEFKRKKLVCKSHFSCGFPNDCGGMLSLMEISIKIENKDTKCRLLLNNS